MSDFRSRLADVADAPRCGDCGGRRIPVSAWLAMPIPALHGWIGRQQADLARAQRLKSGDRRPDPLLCRCTDTLRAAIKQLRGER